MDDCWKNTLCKKNWKRNETNTILGIILIWIIIVKNKSEPISIYEIVRICYVWWPLRESEPKRAVKCSEILKNVRFARSCANSKQALNFAGVRFDMKWRKKKKHRKAMLLFSWWPLRESEPKPALICGWNLFVHRWRRLLATATPFAWDRLLQYGSAKRKTPHLRCFLFGDPYGNRTHIFAVRGRRLNRLTKGPCVDCDIITHSFRKSKPFFTRFSKS